MAKCGWFDFWEENGGHVSASCDREAAYTSRCDQAYGPVCEDHKCRCSITFAEAERRREARVIPASWWAL